jgi:hypothetical protein
MLRLLVMSIAVMMAMRMPAQAAPIIEFTTGPAGSGGSIAWDGTITVGSGIPIGAMRVDFAPMNNGVYLVSGPAGGVYGSLDFHQSVPPNFISITGCIPALSIGTVDAAGDCVQPVMLLDGTLLTYATGPLIGTQLSWGMAGFGTGTKHALLLDAIGVGGEGLIWYFTASARASSLLNPDGVPRTVDLTSVRSLAQPIPEPGTWILLGSGLVGGIYSRRRSKGQGSRSCM